jgi:putative ATP-dependent endonuclease of OLD family
MAPPTPPQPPAPPERIAVVEVRLEGFRNFDDCALPIAIQTLLVGENNSGKSSFLYALAIALGSSQPRPEDFRSANGVSATEFIIDVRAEPATGITFDTTTTQLLSTAVQIVKSPAKQFFTLRCRGSIDQQGEITIRRCFLRGWGADRISASKVAELSTPGVSQKHRELFTFTVLDARRDIAAELRNRRSYWGRLLSDLQLPPQSRTDLEAKLSAISETLLKDSGRLTSIQDTLRSISSVIARADIGIHIAPVPTNLDDLVRFVDILVGEQANSALPVQQEGMGTRSLLAIMLFEAFVEDVLKGASSYTLPITAIEEPEAHVHPHVQRALLPQLHKLRGQVIVSTHSPQVASVSDLFSLRVFRRTKAGSTVRWVRRCDANGNIRIDNEGVSLLQRFIQHRNGDVFFCRAVALFEGDTEDAALPVFAEAALGKSGNAAGLSLVNVGGAGNYKHFVPLLEDLGIPWFILSDGDQAGIDGVSAAGKALARTLDANSPEVVIFPDGRDFEAQLIADGLRGEAETAISRFYGPNALADLKAQLHGSTMRGGIIRDYATQGWEDRLVHDFLDKHKGSFGAAFAREVVQAGKEMLQVSTFFSKFKTHLS